jgi:uncharacterized peroxidase-related enzyme
MSAWIRMISDKDADRELRDILDLSRTPHGTVDNVMRVHSLRPNTMKGHVALYRAALHDKANTIPAWFQEIISSYVSILNGCVYSLENHWENARHLINNEARANKIKKCLIERRPQDAFRDKELAFLLYAEKLTISPTSLIKTDLEDLKSKGIDDGQILEANQIICYFNYVNRSINGLGVTTDGDTVGYYKKS